MADLSVEDLTVTIEVLQEQLDEAESALTWDRLGLVLRARYELAGDRADADRAVTAHERAIALAPAGDADLAGYGTNLCHALIRRFEADGYTGDLDAAIQAIRDALGLTPADSLQKARRVGTLGLALNARFEAAGALSDLEDAVAALWTSVDAAGTGTSEWAVRNGNLGRALVRRFERMGDLADIEAAVRAHQGSLSVATDSSSLRAGRLVNLGRALYCRATALGDLSDLDGAVQAFEQALATGQASSPSVTQWLNNLGIALRTRFEEGGRVEDLDRAIDSHRRAAARARDRQPDWAATQSNLGLAFAARFVAFGESQDVHDAIAAHGRALSATPRDSVDWAGWQNNLGIGLVYRFVASGDVTDLDRAIGAFRKALSDDRHGDPDRSAWLSNLGVALRTRYDLLGRQTDIDEALVACRAALHSARDGSPSWAGWQNNLANVLLRRFGALGDLSDLDGSIKAFRSALDAVRAGSPDWASWQNNLASALLQKFWSSNNVSWLEDAITAYQWALSHAREQSTDLSRWYGNLGHALRVRYELLGEAEDLNRAIAAYLVALAGLDADAWPGHALTTAHDLGRLYAARGAWSEASTVLRHGVRAIHALYRAQILTVGQQAWLAQASDIFRLAAYAFARMGQIQDAVVTLEQGRARLLGEALARDRADLERVKGENPAAYDRYRRAAVSLRWAEIRERSDLPLANLPEADALREQARQAWSELASAVEEIRRIPGHERLLSDASWSDISDAVPDRHSPPIVYLITTTHGGLALIVRRTDPADGSSSVGVGAVWIDTFTSDQLDELLTVRDDGGTEIGAALPALLDRLLPRVGDSLVRPIAARLRGLEVPDLVLIPCGQLGLLPLHAAQFVVDGRATCLLDLFAVSYAPSARFLSASRSARALAPTRGRTLAGVGNPLPHEHPLPFAALELEVIGEQFEARAATLYGEEATMEGLLAALPGSTYVHLACHGVFDAQAPLESRLDLARAERLTLRRVLDEACFQDARLVVISACQTALTELRRLPDECIGLPAGCLQAGAAAVVATLWVVDDLSTAVLMVKLYECLLRGDTIDGAMTEPIGRAMREAQQWLRSVTNAQLAEVIVNLSRRGLTRHEQLDDLLRDRLDELILADQDARPYAHPYYWAPFAVFGL